MLQIIFFWHSLVTVSHVPSTGGFAVVYKTRSNRGKMYALKRMAVNTEHNLYLAKQEIAITVSLCLRPLYVYLIGLAIVYLFQISAT